MQHTTDILQPEHKTLKKQGAKGKAVALLLGSSFLTLGIVLTVIFKQIFFLINFGYIGLGLGLGLFLYNALPAPRKFIGRQLSQFMVGLYLFVLLGIIARLNMQLEGVWFEVLYGIATAPLMHYLVAKIIGPLFFGRIYCSWGCWSSMIFNLFPYKRSPGRVPGFWGSLRYLHFLISLGAVLMAWFFFSYNTYAYFPVPSKPETTAYNDLIGLSWFLIGNAFYYGLGILLIFLLKDNRAFCKYVCPVTTFLKSASVFSLLKIKGKKEECTGCKSCTKACPMDIKIDEYVAAGKRVLSNECVLCLTCTNTCPQKILSANMGLDAGFKQKLRYRNEKEEK